MSQTINQQRQKSSLSKFSNLISERTTMEGKELSLWSKEIKSSIIQLTNSVSIEFVWSNFKTGNVCYKFEFRKGIPSNYYKKELEDSKLTQHQFAKGFFYVKFPRDIKWFTENKGAYLPNNVEVKVKIKLHEIETFLQKDTLTQILEKWVNQSSSRLSNFSSEDPQLMLDSVLDNSDPLKRSLIESFKAHNQTSKVVLNLFDLRLPNYILFKYHLINLGNGKLINLPIEVIKKLGIYLINLTNLTERTAYWPILKGISWRNQLGWIDDNDIATCYIYNYLQVAEESNLKPELRRGKSFLNSLIILGLSKRYSEDWNYELIGKSIRKSQEKNKQSLELKKTNLTEEQVLIERLNLIVDDLNNSLRFYYYKENVISYRFVLPMELGHEVSGRLHVQLGKNSGLSSELKIPKIIELSIDVEGWSKERFLNNLAKRCFGTIPNSYKDDVINSLEYWFLSYLDPLTKLLIGTLNNREKNVVDTINLLDLRLPKSVLKKLFPTYSHQELLNKKRFKWLDFDRTSKEKRIMLEFLSSNFLEKRNKDNLINLFERFKKLNLENKNEIIDTVVEELPIHICNNYSTLKKEGTLIFSYGKSFELVLPYNFKGNKVFLKQGFLRGKLLRFINYDSSFQIERHLKSLKGEHDSVLEEFWDSGTYISSIEVLESLNFWIRLSFYELILKLKIPKILNYDKKFMKIYNQDDSYWERWEKDFNSDFLLLIKSRLREELSSDPNKDLTFQIVNFLFDCPNQESFSVDNFKFEELNNVNITYKLMGRIWSITYKFTRWVRYKVFQKLIDRSTSLISNLVDEIFEQQYIEHCYKLTYDNYRQLSLIVCTLWIYIEGYQGIIHTGLLLVVIPFLIRQFYLPIITELEREIISHSNLSEEEKIRHCENKIEKEELEYQYWTELDPSRSYSLDEILQMRSNDYQTTKMLAYQGVTTEQLEKDKKLASYRKNKQNRVENLLVHSSIGIGNESNSIFSYATIFFYNLVTSNPFGRENYILKSLKKNLRKIRDLPFSKEFSRMVDLRFSNLSFPYYSLIVYGVQLTVLILLVLMLVAQLHNQNKDDDSKVFISPVPYLIV